MKVSEQPKDRFGESDVGTIVDERNFFDISQANQLCIFQKPKPPPAKKKNWLCALCYSVQLVNNCKSCKCCFVTLSINAILKDVWRLVKTTCSDQQITFCYYSSPGHTKRFFKIFLVFKKTTSNRQSRFRYSCTGSVKWKIGSRGIAKYHDLFNF